VAAPRRLLARLRDMMASGAAPMSELAAMIAREMMAEVCSIYAKRVGDLLELVATEGLNPAAVGRTRLRVGEGIIGLAAATGQVLNLADAQNHPGFAYRPETGEEPFASMLAVPVRRAGRTVGVLSVQNRSSMQYAPEAVEVLETVAMVLAEMLSAIGASDATEQGLAATLQRLFEATPIVPGIVIAPVVVHGVRPIARNLLSDDPDAEKAKLEAASVRMRRDLDQLIAARMPDGDAPREVLEAYRLVAADAGWLKRVNAAIDSGLSAEAAIQRVAGEVRDRMRRIADPYLRERMADLDDLAGRLLLAMDGAAERPPVPPGAILLARRLGPADLLDWHARGIGGLMVEEASPAGHAAIVARAIGLPALGGARGVVDAAEDGDAAIIDAESGQFILRPELDLRRVYENEAAHRRARRAGWAALREKPAETADGTQVKLMLNAGLALELAQLEATGADGIGLFRTEIAMLARGAVADLAEQTAIYSRVLDAAGNRPVLFRTLDLGGDKLLPGSELPEEENPAMGWRSIRIGLDRPALLRRQVRALLLAAGGRPLSIMFPMIAEVAEFRVARSIVMVEAARVRPAPESLRIGTMLEVPSLLFQLPALLAEVDFVSIGSNDLMQFLFAADRGAPTLAGRYDLLSPPMFDLIETVVREAGAAGVPVSLCGEAAGRPLEALVLVALGLTTLSMPAAGILPIKELLHTVDLTSFRPVLSALRANAGGDASLREPLVAWARSHGLDV
jgi:phosphotransferase system enzyme I (PtsP)